MNDNYLRILRVRLLLIEKCLRDIIDKLEYDRRNSIFIMYSFKNTIDYDRRTRLLGIINSMLYEINQMKKNFALESEELSVTRSIIGNLDEVWTTLEDTMPEKLSKGYGIMSKADEELLRHGILKLLPMVNHFYTELEHAKSGV
jgi:hypothetical protein